MTHDPPHSRPKLRRDGWTPVRRLAFLEALRASDNVRLAAKAVGMSRESAYRLRRRSPQFAQGWASAVAYDVPPPPRLLGTGTLWDQAMIGVDREIRYHNKRIGHTRRLDNAAGMRLLNQLDRQIECREIK